MIVHTLLLNLQYKFESCLKYILLTLAAEMAVDPLFCIISATESVLAYRCSQIAHCYEMT